MISGNRDLEGVYVYVSSGWWVGLVGYLSRERAIWSFNYKTSSK